jgi:hypothetical protein
MARSFLTHLLNSITRVVPLVPCLLMCLSCATPFPIEKLEEGMTTETVLANFGTPKASEIEWEDTQACWSYVHEKRAWFSLVRVVRNMVLLDFEEDRLVGWDVYEPQTVPAPWWLKHDSTPIRAESPCPPYCSSHVPHCYPPDCSLSTGSGPTTVALPFPAPPTCESVRAQAGRPEGLRVGDTSYVRPNQVSLWSEPTTPRARRAYLDRGQRLKIVDKHLNSEWRRKIFGKQDGPALTWWCHVEDDGGGKGWILCEFLAASKPR